MIDVEKIIDEIQSADEIEILEFDFDECFTALRNMDYALRRIALNTSGDVPAQVIAGDTLAGREIGS